MNEEKKQGIIKNHIGFVAEEVVLQQRKSKQIYQQMLKTSFLMMVLRIELCQTKWYSLGVRPTATTKNRAFGSIGLQETMNELMKAKPKAKAKAKSKDN